MVLASALLLLAQPAIPADAKALVAQVQRETLPPASIRWAMKKNGKWIRMKTSEDHLKDGMWDEAVSTVASVGHSKGQYTVVTLSDSSPSGDWMETYEYIYRPNGKLARANFRHLRIDYGGREIGRWYTRQERLAVTTDTALSGIGEASKTPEAVKIAKEFKLDSYRVYSSYQLQPIAKLIKL